MNSKILFLLFLLVSCGVKKSPIIPGGKTPLPSIYNDYKYKDDIQKKEKDSKEKKKVSE